MLPSSLFQQTLLRLRTICERHRHPVFSTALGTEGVALLHMIAAERLPVRVITLNTGMLPRETLELLDSVKQQLHIPIEEVLPDPDEVAHLERSQGKFGMYDSVQSRQRCCEVRKLLPLQRALQGADAWLTGLRQAHSHSRQATALEEHDVRTGLPKYNPVADWTDEDVHRYLSLHQLPVNALYHRGYASIGCQPCTRALKPGESARAGRWWWESNGSKECGLHSIAVVPRSG